MTELNQPTTLEQKIETFANSVQDFLDTHKLKECEIDLRDLEIALSYTHTDIKSWIPRKIREMLKKHNIWLYRVKGTTSILCSNEKTNFGEYHTKE